MTPSEHVGQRVRMYREKKGISLTKFAKMINKSPSTVSKYESGAIVIDVNVLVELASVLEVSIGQLIDYKVGTGHRDRETAGDAFFRRTDLFYLYTTISTRSPRKCAMELNRNKESLDEGTCIFYFDIEPHYHHTRSKSLYEGTFRCFNNGIVFNLENPYNPSDVAMIYAKPPLDNNEIAVGIFTLQPYRYRNPCSTKVIISTIELPIDDMLTSALNVSDKETFATLKKQNIFLVS